MTEKLAILDCGGQYTKVIDRKVRELGVMSDIFSIGADPAVLSGYGGIILSGGPSSVWDTKSPRYDEGIFELGVPMLGICYGFQLITKHFGGEVKPAGGAGHPEGSEYGQTEVTLDTGCPLFRGLAGGSSVLMSHGDSLTKLPDGFKTIAETGRVVAGIYDGNRKIAGVQFHPEVDLTDGGIVMLENFLRGICGFKEKYALEDRIASSVEMIRRRVGDKNVIVLVSGGVDSAVTAALLLRALKPEQVFAIHVDHGLMRAGESDLICENLGELGLVNLTRLNAEEDFFNMPLEINGRKYPPLCEVIDPEIKRSIIGHMFVEVTRRAVELTGVDFDQTFLAQGTLRPDLIESGNPDVSSHANTIKTHHNDVDIIRRARARGMIIETNYDWHKDEVRRVARMLGLSEDIASRQPFPGPGLGVRILCGDSGNGIGDGDSGGEKPERNKYTEMARVVSELPRMDVPGLSAVRKKFKIPELYYSAVPAPVRSVGVQGDCRSYRSLAVIAGGTWRSLAQDWGAIKEIARALPNSLDFINRAAYLLDRIELECALVSRRCRVCRETADLLRAVDRIVTEEVRGERISQCFAVLVPASISEGEYSVAVRAVVTSDFMTAKAAQPGVDFPGEALGNVVKRIRMAEMPVDMVLYDVTGKPPATVEWE